MPIESKIRHILKHGKITRNNNEFIFYPDQKYYRKFGFKSHINGFKSDSLNGIIELAATLLR